MSLHPNNMCQVFQPPTTCAMSLNPTMCHAISSQLMSFPFTPTCAISLHPKMCHVLAPHHSFLSFLIVFITVMRNRAIFFIYILFKLPLNCTFNVCTLGSNFAFWHTNSAVCVFMKFCRTVLIWMYFQCSQPRQSGNTHEKYKSYEFFLVPRNCHSAS
jgi:hypothetical protein